MEIGMKIMNELQVVTSLLPNSSVLEFDAPDASASFSFPSDISRSLEYESNIKPYLAQHLATSALRCLNLSLLHKGQNTRNDNTTLQTI
jgi:hypothetical protein